MFLFGQPREDFNVTKTTKCGKCTVLSRSHPLGKVFQYSLAFLGGQL
jgi:hypothetical protein